MKEKKLLKKLSAYPMVFECFTEYVRWVITNVPNDELLGYDLISVLVEGQEERLERTEMLLVQASSILGMQPSRFCRSFGFRDDLLVDDPEKLHDVLAEPLVAVDLKTNGFRKIRKITSLIKSNGKQLPTADFTAVRNSHKYSIEVKTVRMEKDIEPGKPMGNALSSYWWGKMFINNSITKIEDKDRRVLDQLNNTAQHFDCDLKLLVLYSRRLGPSTLLDEREVMQELERLAAMYGEIDCFCVKLYFGEVYFYANFNSRADSVESP
jgi:hypothetical protein